MSTWPAGVLFDFDGVIVDSEPLHLRGFQQVLAGEGIELSGEDYYRNLIGFDDRGAFAHVFHLHGRPLDPTTARRLEGAKAAAVQGMITRGDFSALPGVDELVRGLARHYPLAICSGALREEIELMLEGISLRDCFQVITAAEDVTQAKPHPEGYLKTARLLREQSGLKFGPEDCLVIEDAPTVISAVKAEGFQTLGVATTYPMSALTDADFIVARLTPAEVLKQIPRLKIGV